MKKTITLSVIAVLVFPFVSSASTVCKAGDKFNINTGAPCTQVKVSIVCKPGDLFNTLTGQRCVVQSVDIQETQADHDAEQARRDEVAKQRNLQSDYTNTIDAILHRNDAALKAQQTLQDSPECIAATNTYNTIQQQYTALNNHINSEGINSTYYSQDSFKETDLAVKQSAAQSAEYKACYNFVGAPQRIINTNCSNYGSLISCTSF